MKINKIYQQRLNEIGNEKYFINAHTHIFNANDTPNHLVKRFVIWPFYYLLNTQWAISILKKHRKRQAKKFRYRAKNKIWQKYRSSKSPIFELAKRVFLIVVNIIFFFYALYIIQPIFTFWPIKGWLNGLYENEISQYLLFFPKRFYYISIILFIFLFFKKIKNWFFSLIWKSIKKRLGNDWVEFMLRYRNILLFAGYGNMKGIFNKLKNQYPPGTKFVALPMDMEFMAAGPVKRPYRIQMAQLLKIKKSNSQDIYPFLFAHPKRMIEVHNGKPYFKGNLNGSGKYILGTSEVKDYFENGCTGVKIYPAMGYYPFDETLLPLWLYCAQNNIPITTHCSVGPIFYRGNLKDLEKGKKKTFKRGIDRHPVFDEIIGKNLKGKNKIEPFRLPLHKNRVFQRNFTHPLNYVCLLNETFLKRVLDFHNDSNLNKLFGYDPENNEKKLDRNLSNLKINLAHYGGSENWDEFLAKDRFDEANAIINKPTIGLDLLNRMDNLTILYSLWHYVDWFSIISSMMLSFDNVYTDISYTVHDLKYLNLLSEIMDNKKIGKRILFGTDFYVVSNHKSEKQYWIDMQNTLGHEKWNRLAHTNPKRFLNF
ncbi:Amidohydrolase [Maribacter sedimenticola]|uniref:Amidohydrolase n=1 Tax=Maribacter sedimenticola TaxID=228956 RepID=A0ABY1SJM2_9FLAO|nr:amidohydrolase family protein [Maribacter sedimenticola]SNR60441.1 Amidohydrolase [Maribacter sedimenticola]